MAEADRNRTPKLSFLVERVGARASQQERDHSLTDSRRHRGVCDGSLQIGDRDDRSICVLCEHTFAAIVREDQNCVTYGRAPTKELLHNIDQITRLMTRDEPVRDPASVGDPIHR